MARAKRTVCPEISGGINRSVGADSIEDGQSPDMLNFWQKNGRLTLRPGLKKLFTQEYGPVICVYPRDGSDLLISRVTQNGAVEEKRGFYILTKKAVLIYDGQSCTRVPDSLFWKDGWQTRCGDYDFTGCALLPYGTANDAFGEADESVCVEGARLCVVGNGLFQIAPHVVVYEMPTGVPHSTAACLIESVTPHIPVLYGNCASNGTGTKNEEPNLLTPLRIQKFTTDAISTTYRLCEDNLDNAPVTAVYSPAPGAACTFFFDRDCTLAQQGTLIASLDRAAGTLFFLSTLIDSTQNGVLNNLVVTYSKTDSDTVGDGNAVACCSFGIWFGGGTQSVSGCSRLFLAGCAAAPNRIYYCAAADLTYFAKNAYIDIGSPSDPITALGIQFDTLVVLKKGSVYALDYADTPDTAAFTVRVVNPAAGCDMPGSVCLLSNLLVWGDSAGGLNTLQSTSVANERAVRVLSRNIAPLLSALPKETLQAACAVCDGSRYLLLAGSTVFVLDYEKLQIQNGLPKGANWFVWTLP